MGRFADAWSVLVGKQQQNRRLPLPPAGRRPGRGRASRSFDGASLARGDDWLGSGSDPVSEIAGGLEQVRKRSRDLVQNNAYARQACNAWVNAVVATGIRPTVNTGDAGLDAAVYELWEEWGKAPIPGLKITIYGWQRMMARAGFVDGEGLTRLRPRFVRDMPGLPPLKLQSIEADQLPIDKTEAVGNGSNRIYSGVEFDALGEVAAYHLTREHPGAALPFFGASPWDIVRVQASSMIHLFDPERPGQVRGMPRLAPVIMGLWDLQGYTEAIRIGTRAAATLVATVEGGDEESPPDGIANETDDNGNLVTDGYDNPIEGFQPGQIMYAPNGKKITIHAPQPPAGVSDFVDAALHEIAAGVGLSYHVLSGDMSDSSFAQAKLGLIQQALNVSAYRESVFNPVANDPVWRAFIAASQVAGLLPNNPKLYDVTWSAPKSQSADRLAEAKAAKLEMDLQLRSRTEIIESEGRDPDQVNAEIQADNAERARLGIEFGMVSSASKGDPDVATGDAA